MGSVTATGTGDAGVESVAVRVDDVSGVVVKDVVTVPAYKLY